MNNDLEQFSEERLKKICDFTKGGVDVLHVEIEALARIAIAAKQEFKVNATLRNINLNVSREAYSASLELNDFLKDNQHVYQIMNSLGDSELWVDCSEDAYKCEIYEGGSGRILFTTPQPAHTEQAKSSGNEFLPENLDRALTIMGVALPESKEEFNFQAQRWTQRLINRVIRYEGEIQSQEAHTEQDGWIKCSERMPPNGDPVWAYAQPSFEYAVEAYWDGDWYRTLTDEPEYSITHWMPLPSAPKPESEG